MRFLERFVNGKHIAPPELRPRETVTVTALSDFRQDIQDAADDENEACALVADALAAQWDDEGAIQGACIVADAIRARRKR
jgi:hypothetical protein